MFCSQCGRDIENDAQFCRKCGRATTPPSIATTTEGQRAASAAQGAPKHNNRSTLLILVAILISIMWFAAKSNSTGARHLQQLASQTHTLDIANGSVPVNANSYYYYRFAVMPGSSDATVQGHFSAEGGSGNDIEVYLFSEDDFANWKNGHRSKVYYQSGKATRGSINARLGSTPGSYYLVLDNRFSLLSSKAVQLDATLSYRQ